MAMITAQQLNAIKARVKAEMLRRCGYGSLYSYGAASYDFTVTPSAGTKVLTEQGQKVIDLILKIEDVPDLINVQQYQKVPTQFVNDVLSSELTKLEKEPMNGSSSSCRGACTGLCLGTCSSGCSGCSGGCSGCSASCKSDCAANCGSGCASGCGSSCQGGCGDSCGGCSGCSGGCGSGCTGGCLGCAGCGTCSGTCGGSCSSGCSGCGGCGNTCNNTCGSGCSNCSGCAGRCGNNCSRQHGKHYLMVHSHRHLPTARADSEWHLFA